MSIMAKEQGKRKRVENPDASAAKRSKKDFAKPSYKHGKPAAAKSAPKLLSKREQKDAVRSKKLKFKKNYETIHESVLLWEQLRPKQTTKEEKQKLVSTILKKLHGVGVELSNHHSASRVIQWCLKEGSPADKSRLLAEVKANIVELSRSKYGRHVVQKVISMASKEEVPGLAKLFRGHVAELLRHPSGADVLDDLYSVCPQTSRNTLCAELYGREFSLFEGVGMHSEHINHLSELLAGVDGRKRQAVVEHLYKGLAPVLEKALLHPVMTHRLLRELLTEAPGSIVADVVDTLAAAGGNALKLVHTHDGAAAAAMALAYATPKDRKRLVKGMKGYVWQTTENEWGHVVIATALSVVDDTSLTGKTILGELKPHLEDMCSSKHAHRVLMQLLAPDNHRYLPPAIYELLHPPVKTMMVPADDRPAAAAGVEADDEEFVEAADDEDPSLQDQPSAGGDSGAQDDMPQEENVSHDEQSGDESEEELSVEKADQAASGAGDTGSGDSEQPGAADSQTPHMVERRLGESKKAADVRRRELLGSGKGSLSSALVALCAAQAGGLLRSQVGGDVVVEVARGAADGLLWQLQQAGLEQVHTAIVQEVAQGISRVNSSSKPAAGQQEQDKKQEQDSAEDSSNVQQGSEPLLTHYFGSRHLRRLLLAGSTAGADGEGARSFAVQLWSHALKGHCQQLLGSHAEKVIAAVLHCGVPAVVHEATAELKPVIGSDVQAWAAKFTGPTSSAAGANTGKQKQPKGSKQQQKPPQQQQQPIPLQQQHHHHHHQAATPSASKEKKKKQQQHGSRKLRTPGALQ